MPSARQVLISFALIGLLVLIFTSVVYLGRDERVSYSPLEETVDGDRSSLVPEGRLITAERSLTPSPSPSLSPSSSGSLLPQPIMTVSRTSSRTCSVVKSPSLTPAPSPSQKSDKRKLGAEGRYNVLLESTMQDMALLAPEVSMPVDACPTDAPCLLGDIVLLHQGRCGSHELMEPLGLNTPAGEENPYPWGFSKYAEGFNFNGGGFKWNSTKGLSREDMLLDSLRQVAARVQEVRKPGKHYFLSLKLNQIEKTDLSTHDFLTVLAATGFRHLVETFCFYCSDTMTPVIYRNPIRVRASYAAAREAKDEGVKNPFHEKEEENVNCRPVTLEFRKIAKDFEVTELGYQQALEHPAFRYPIVLEYEKDLYKGPDEAARRVLRELGVNVPARPTELLRTTDCPLSELVENWEEVQMFLDQTAYNWALEPNGVQEPLPGRIEKILRMCRVEATQTRPSFVRCPRTLPVWRTHRNQKSGSSKPVGDWTPRP